MTATDSRPPRLIIPCPHCGDTPRRVVQICTEFDAEHPAGRAVWTVVHICTPGHGYSADEAISNWNARPPCAAVDIDGIALDVAREIKSLDPIAMCGGHDAHLAAIKALVVDAILAASGDPGHGS